jgi:hypothetical protein
MSKQILGKAPLNWKPTAPDCVSAQLAKMELEIAKTHIEYTVRMPCGSVRRQLAVHVFIDVSSSMGIKEGGKTRIDAVKEALLALIEELHDKDAIIIHVFCKTVRALNGSDGKPLVGTKKRLMAAGLVDTIKGLQLSHGTAVFDAIAEGVKSSTQSQKMNFAKYKKAHPQATNAECAANIRQDKVIVLTDGEDYHSAIGGGNRVTACAQVAEIVSGKHVAQLRVLAVGDAAREGSSMLQIAKLVQPASRFVVVPASDAAEIGGSFKKIKKAMFHDVKVVIDQVHVKAAAGGGPRAPPPLKACAEEGKKPCLKGAACTFVLKGACNFLHPREQIPCKNLAAGECKFGAKCNFKH